MIPTKVISILLKQTNIAIAKNKAVQFITRQSSMNDLHGSKHGLALTSYVLQKAGYSEKARLVYADLKAQANTNGISLVFFLLLLQFLKQELYNNCFQMK